MGFGIELLRWDDLFEEELAELRAFTDRACPGVDWDALMQARPGSGGFNLWADFATHLDFLLERYGVRRRQDAVHLVPFDLSAVAPKGPRCVDLRPKARCAWYILDAGWVHRTWRGNADPAYAARINAHADAFDAWVCSTAGQDVEAAIEAFRDRPDGHALADAWVERGWIRVARRVVETRCPARTHS